MLSQRRAVSITGCRAKGLAGSGFMDAPLVSSLKGRHLCLPDPNVFPSFPFLLELQFAIRPCAHLIVGMGLNLHGATDSLVF